MHYDRTWIQFGEQRRVMIERREAKKKNLLDFFEDEVDRLCTQGHFVTISAGKNFAFDEIFLLETQLDAQEFFDLDYREWERFSDDDEVEGYGFQEISLFKGGRQVGSKSCAPSKWVEAADEWDDDFALDILTGELKIISPKWRCSPLKSAEAKDE
jgi:hypothetical protein